MGLFKKKAKEPSEIERLKSEIASMAARLEATDAAKQQLGQQVQGIVTRLDAPVDQPPPPEPPPPSVSPADLDDVRMQLQTVVERLDAPTETEPTVDPEEFEAAGAQIRMLAERIGEVDIVTAQMQTISARIDQLDARITSISNELANQITELSGDIEGLGGSEPDVDLVGQLRDTQAKLANEQARYQIAFRQDLANLADYLKHT